MLWHIQIMNIGRFLPGIHLLPFVFRVGPARFGDPRSNRHEERNGPGAMGDGGWSGRIRAVLHTTLVSRRARRPVRDRRRTGDPADCRKPLRQHPRPDRKRRAAHCGHGHLQQDRRDRRTDPSRHAGVARRG